MLYLVDVVHGFARFLGDLLERHAPEHIAVAFDESLEQSYRNEIYPAYKANREPALVRLRGFDCRSRTFPGLGRRQMIGL